MGGRDTHAGDAGGRDAHTGDTLPQGVGGSTPVTLVRGMPTQGTLLTEGMGARPGQWFCSLTLVKLRCFTAATCKLMALQNRQQILAVPVCL